MQNGAKCTWCNLIYLRIREHKFHFTEGFGNVPKHPQEDLLKDSKKKQLSYSPWLARELNHGGFEGSSFITTYHPSWWTGESESASSFWPLGCAPVMVYSGCLLTHQSWFILAAWSRTSHGSFLPLGCAPVMVHSHHLVVHIGCFFGQSKNTKTLSGLDYKGAT